MKFSGTTAVITGTGTPVPVPGRAGAGVLVRAVSSTLQFDAGRATVLRLAEAGVQCAELDAVFITHQHSDHTSDLFDLLQTAWLQRRQGRLPVVVPEGPAARLVERVLDPFREDIEVRQSHRGEQTSPDPEIRSFTPARYPSTVWEGSGVRVDAIEVRHKPVEAAVGYRIDTLDGRVVISGDTIACEEIELLAEGADVLIHEIARPDLTPERAHVGTYHTLPDELGALAERARVQCLVLTHLWPSPGTPEEAAEFASAVRSAGFGGDIVVACDLTTVQLNHHVVQVLLPSDKEPQGVLCRSSGTRVPA